VSPEPADCASPIIGAVQILRLGLGRAGSMPDRGFGERQQWSIVLKKSVFDAVPKKKKSVRRWCPSHGCGFIAPTASLHGFGLADTSAEMSAVRRGLSRFGWPAGLRRTGEQRSRVA